MSLSLVGNTKCVRIDGQKETLCTTRDHNSQWRGHVEAGHTCVLVLCSCLVVVLPYLVKVECVEEFNSAVERGGDESDVFDVSQLRDWVLEFDLSPSILFSRVSILLLFFCSSSKLCDEKFRVNWLVSISAHIFQLVLKNGVEHRILPFRISFSRILYLSLVLCSLQVSALATIFF